MYSLEVFKAMYFAITLTHFWAPGFLNSRSPNFSKLRVSVRPSLRDCTPLASTISQHSLAGSTTNDLFRRYFLTEYFCKSFLVKIYNMLWVDTHFVIN